MSWGGRCSGSPHGQLLSGGAELGEIKSVRLSNGCFECEFGAWVGLGVELSNLA